MKFQRVLPRSPRDWLWLVVLCSGLGLRLWLASSYYGNFDEASFELTAEIMRRGGNVYVETFRYNYTPIWSYILLALSYGSDWLGLPFHVVSRSFLTGVDLINALLIGRIAAQTFAANPRIGAARYWLNPVAIWLSRSVRESRCTAALAGRMAFHALR
jgi:hypothetical protein